MMTDADKREAAIRNAVELREKSGFAWPEMEFILARLDSARREIARLRAGERPVLRLVK